MWLQTLIVWICPNLKKKKFQQKIKISSKYAKKCAKILAESVFLVQFYIRIPNLIKIDALIKNLIFFLEDSIFLSWNFHKFLKIIPILLNLNIFLNKKWIYSHRFWCDFSDTIRRINKFFKKNYKMYLQTNMEENGCTFSDVHFNTHLNNKLYYIYVCNNDKWILLHSINGLIDMFGLKLYMNTCSPLSEAVRLPKSFGTSIV